MELVRQVWYVILDRTVVNQPHFEVWAVVRPCLQHQLDERRVEPWVLVIVKGPNHLEQRRLHLLWPLPPRCRCSCSCRGCH
jgi:hypothetical protein